MVENLALQVKSCFCCSCLPEKWEEEADQGFGHRLKTPNQGQTWAGTFATVPPAASKLVAVHGSAPNNFSPHSDKLLVLASEQASCRLSKPTLVKVRNFKPEKSLRSIRDGLYFRASVLIPEENCQTPHGPAGSGHLQFRDEW